jgi:hypothetical protein
MNLKQPLFILYSKAEESISLRLFLKTFIIIFLKSLRKIACFTVKAPHSRHNLCIPLAQESTPATNVAFSAVYS